MATYIVTTSNWNSAAFWSGISQSRDGDTLDFSALPDTYLVDLDPDTNRLLLSDGETSFLVGDSAYEGDDANATLGGSSLFSFFTIIKGDADDRSTEDAKASETPQAATVEEATLNETPDDNEKTPDSSDSLTTSPVEEPASTGGSGADSRTLDMTAFQSGVEIIFSGDTAGTVTNGSDTGSFSGVQEFITTNFDDTVTALNSSADLVFDLGDGDDTLLSGSGADFIEGGDGADSVDGNVGDDTLIGGAGNDTILGMSGDDSIQGGDGGDVLEAGSGNDTVEGGRGNDVITSWSGTASLSGGDDADEFFLFDDFADSTVIGGEGGVDADALELWGMSGPVSVTYKADEAGTITDGTDALTFSEIERLTLTQGADRVDGAEADTSGIDVDLLGGNDVAVGTDFGDTIAGGAGDDYIEGGLGDDFLTTGTGQDTLIGGAGDDTLMNSDGDDSLDGGAGSDSIVATGGDDTLRGGTGADKMDGGDDADTFIIEDDFGNDTIRGGEGGTDDDVIDLSALTGPVTVTYGSDDESGRITDGTDTISFSEIERIITTDQADSVDATAVWDGMFGDNPGIDIETRGGDDTIVSGFGGDTIDGGAGNDNIDGDYGDDSLIGGSGSDTLVGSTGNDTLIGGAGNDRLDGGEEDDTLEGGAGDDSITGGDGDDVFVYSPGDGNDTITDFNTGNSGTLDDGDSTNNDFIDLSGYYDHISELYADQADDGVLNQSNATDTRGNSTDYSDNTAFGSGSVEMRGASADSASFSDENTGVVCFTSGTAIRTPQGNVAIDALRVGDLVCTMDNGPQPVRWIHSHSLGRAELAAAPHLRPVLIGRGVLGVARNLLVSPQHGMVIGAGRHLARAKHLAKTTKGIRIAYGKQQVTYVHLMFDQHEVIFAENAPSESFYPGPMAIKALDTDARNEMFSLFADIGACTSKQAVALAYGDTVRGFVRARDIERCLSMRAPRAGGIGLAPRVSRDQRLCV